MIDALFDALAILDANPVWTAEIEREVALNSIRESRIILVTGHMAGEL